jgi:hypothetical protein
MKHRTTIPGLDYDYCDRCGNYLIRDCEIERLKNLIATAMARNRGKEAQELQALINREKFIRHQPCEKREKSQKECDSPTSRSTAKDLPPTRLSASKKSEKSEKLKTGN